MIISRAIGRLFRFRLKRVQNGRKNILAILGKELRMTPPFQKSSVFSPTIFYFLKIPEYGKRLAMIITDPEGPFPFHFLLLHHIKKETKRMRKLFWFLGGVAAGLAAPPIVKIVMETVEEMKYGSFSDSNDDYGSNSEDASAGSGSASKAEGAEPEAQAEADAAAPAA
jgi:hypothetical protein